MPYPSPQEPAILSIVASHILVFQVQNAERLRDLFGAAAVDAALADAVVAMDAHGSRLLGRHHAVPSPPSAMPGRWWRGFTVSGSGSALVDIAEQAEALAAVAGGQLVITNDPIDAVTGAQAVYTDVWASMGQEHEKAKRLADFAPYQVNAALFEHAAPEAIFLHCLPAKRGEEVVDEVIESSQSAVFDQAENRLHVQKALLLMLLG